MTRATRLTFPNLEQPGLQHCFTLRGAGSSEIQVLPGQCDNPALPCIQAAQIHGNRVAAVDFPDAGCTIPDVDALVTSTTGLTLVIRVADCGPLYFYDPVRRVIGLAHSGRRGTELNIAGATLGRLEDEYGCRPADLVVVLGPCIRPPHYEVDFAGEIQRQVRSAGVLHFHDCGFNTASDPTRFFSYRMERGKTGRHHAMLKMT